MINHELLQTLTDMLHTDFKVAGGKIELQDSSSSPVILNKSGKVLQLRFDKDSVDIFPYLEKSFAGSRTISDNVLIYTHKGKLFVFIIELKTKNTTGALEQARAGFALAKYICETARRLQNYPTIGIEYRALIFSNRVPPLKQTTKPQRIYIENDRSGLQFVHLKAGQSYDLNALCH
jgi:hypothetical protein